MKRTIRLNERELRGLISESVKRVLRDGGDRINREVEEYVHSLGSSIYEWVSPNEFVDNHGCNGFIFDDEESAEESVLTGDEHQNAIDFVEGAMSDEDWIDYFNNIGVDSEEAREIIGNQDWDYLVSIIVKNDGPEWFLAGYSGRIHTLSDGRLLYY